MQAEWVFEIYLYTSFIDLIMQRMKAVIDEPINEKNTGTADHM